MLKASVYSPCSFHHTLWLFSGASADLLEVSPQIISILQPLLKRQRM